MKSSAPKMWIVKDVEGKIFGPFSTEQVLEQIDKNYFLGGESVALYPGGRWTAISKAPEFYDRLLDVIASEDQASRPKKKRAPENNPIVEPPPNQNQEPPSDLPVVSKVMRQPPLDDMPEERALVPTGHSNDDQNAVIELTDLRDMPEVGKLKSSRGPLIFVLAGLIVIGVIYMFSGDSSFSENRIHLLAPRKGQSELSESKIKDKLVKALASFQIDTFSGYQRAENELVEIVEGASTKPELGLKKAEMLSTLCLVYRELWPYSYQDSKDMKTINTVMQEAKRLDPAGLHGGLCEIVNLMLEGRYRDAQGLAESMLLEESQAPVLFEIRGDIYTYSHDHASAATYFQQARTLWPTWQKSYIEEAHAHAEQKQFPEAIQLYKDVLAKVPNHAVAKIELGMIEALQFSQYDKGLELLQSGLDGERVPRSVESMGYYGLAKIYLQRKQAQKALSMAKKAYALNSANILAKQLLTQLGGDGAPKETKFQGRELLYLGEQYVRSGDCYAAQAEFKAAFDAEPKNGLAAMKASKCLWQLNQSADAIDWMKKAIDADPKLIEAYAELADYYAQRFDYYLAVETLKHAQHQGPNNYEVYRGFATVELRRNNYQGAIGFADRALKIYETDLDTILIMAKSYLGLRNYADAQRFAAKGIELDFNSTEAHALYAKAEVGLHGLEAGESYIQQMINRYVINKGQQVPQAAIDYRITLGEIYVEDEQYRQAEDLYRQAISLDPNNKRALVDLGKALQAENHPQDALTYYLRAAVLDPSDAEPIFLSGQLYADTGKVPEAERQFERVLKQNPRYPKTHAEIGRLQLRRGDGKKALEEATLEQATNPDLSDGYVVAAEAFFNLRQFSNCAGQYQKAVAKRGQDVSILVRMARCYRLAGSLESAQSLLRQAESIESGFADIYKEQGAISHTKGNADEAVAAYDKYLSLAPNATDRADVEARIRRVQAGDLNVGE